MNDLRDLLELAVPDDTTLRASGDPADDLIRGKRLLRRRLRVVAGGTSTAVAAVAAGALIASAS